jgi:hypothetical protein
MLPKAALAQQKKEESTGLEQDTGGKTRVLRTAKRLNSLIKF